MKPLAEYLELAAAAHGHLCAGQVLGVRLAMLGLRELGVEDPVAERKRIVTYVEIDRCVTDAVALVANCRLGKRSEEHTSELQSRSDLVCRLLLEKKKKKLKNTQRYKAEQDEHAM